ncbi:NAD(P)-dependent oxidoreductase [Catenulispora sp. NF23]|uniref:NAD(P)-dependent oxidoreductase n=1 Tax=Catenulispora pinistramenti TaxID=2705254 RepID=UPI001BA6C17B|nr:NAD(P)-dependent oxidoreductase [Catenulispora pinistramenti]MBS2535751.1 NAD(P)-dependent oxidoreductase [Catenulispora pinistramenti]
MTTKVAFLGLGAMGAPMAVRLVRAGYDVVVWNRTAARAEPLTTLGATAAATPAEAVAGAEVVVTMLSDPAAVTAVAEAVAPALRPDAVLVEMSTIGPDGTRHVRELIPASVGMVDAPVMGSVDRAASGALTVLAGGTPRDLARVADLLAVFGTVTECGGPGAGSARKLVLISGIVAGVTVVGETLALAERLGLDDPRAVLEASPLSGLAARLFADGVDFSAEMAGKDLRLAGEVLDLPVMAAARQVLESAPDQDADLGAAVRAVNQKR